MNHTRRRGGAVAASMLLPGSTILVGSPSSELISFLKENTLTVIAVADSSLLKKSIRSYLKQQDILVYDYNVLTESLVGAKCFSTETHWERYLKVNQVLARITARAHGPAVAIMEVKAKSSDFGLIDIHGLGDLHRIADRFLFLDRRSGIQVGSNIIRLNGLAVKRLGHLYNFRNFNIDWDLRRSASVGQVFS